MQKPEFGRTFTTKMSLDEEEKSLSSNFFNLDVQEENSTEIPYGNIRNSSKYFSERSSSLTNLDRRNSDRAYRSGPQAIPLVQRK